MELETVVSLEEARILVNNKKYQLVIADYRLADGEGLALVDICLEKLIPLVVLTSQGSESIAVEALKKGAFDYVVKNETTLADMSRVAYQALKEWDLILKRKQTEKLLSLIADSLITQLIVINQEGIVTLANNALTSHTSCPLIPPAGLMGLDFLEFLKDVHSEHGHMRIKVFDVIQRIKSGLIKEEFLDLNLDVGEKEHHYEVRIKSIASPLQTQILIAIDDMTVRYQIRQQTEAREKNQLLIQRLSPREREVLNLVSQGTSNKQIAHQLHLSDRTVEKHRAYAMKKLRIKSVADIVKIFVNTAVE